METRFAIDCDGTLIVEGGPGSGNRGHAGRPGEVGGSAPDGAAGGGTSDGGSTGTKVYHATAEHFAKSILKEGLRASKAGTGMIKGVYASVEPGEAFSYGVKKTEDVFSAGLRAGKYKMSDLGKLKVMLIVADRAYFPETVYKNTATQENTIFRSKGDIPPSVFRRVEVYKYSDAEKFAKKYFDAMAEHKPFPTMPPPSPESVISASKVSEKRQSGNLYISFGFNTGAEEQVSEVSSKESILELARDLKRRGAVEPLIRRKK